MKLADAPPAGWYPDPIGGVRLRWWDGTDWTERYRSRPGAGELLALSRREREAGQRGSGPRSTGRAVPGTPAGVAGMSAAEAAGFGGVSAGRVNEADRIVAEVRQAARDEASRAADIFTSRAEAAARGFQPLITEYTSKLLRWFRVAAVLALVLAVGWFVFEFVVQASLLDWLGDRIDNLSS